MKLFLSAAIIVSAGLAGAATAAPVQTPPPSPADRTGGTFWANTRWDDDSEDRRRYGPMPRPDQRALRAVGVVRVLEVERDDGRLEIEGLDARGHEVDVLMDVEGRRVLASHIDDDRDGHRVGDRWVD